MFGRSASSPIDPAAALEAWETEVIERIARRFCRDGGEFSESDREDLIQEGWLVWLLARADPSKRTKPYLAAVVCNRFLDMIDAEKAQKRRAYREAVSLDAAVDADGKVMLGEQVGDRSQQTEADFDSSLDLQSTVAELDERDRAIVALCFDGFNQGEIATKLSISRATVNARVKRIREAVKNGLLGKKMPE